jgi:hypothetical protein
VTWVARGALRRRLPKGARRLCQRCGAVSILRQHGRRFCKGCTRNDADRRAWKKRGQREPY